MIAGLLPVTTTVAAAQAPLVQFGTPGGDAWTFSKAVSGHYEVCDTVVLHSRAATVPATLDGGRFFARIPLGEGLNEVTAECRDANASSTKHGTQRWNVRAADVPKAWVRTRVTDGDIALDADRSARAPATPARIVRYLWRERPGNPAPLFAAQTGRPLDGDGVEGKGILIAAPQEDGDYFVDLRITDALGRSDTSAAMFRVEDGRAGAVDLADEHPGWVDSAVLYGIAPHFYGDDELDGVAARLDEIAALGATAIWLSPVTEAPPDDFGYAALDHFAVRDRFGDAADLRALVERAHALGLKVLIDFVPNHVSDRHPYFQSAERLGTGSAYFNWFERGPDGEVASYFDWSNLKNLDYDNPDVQAYVIAAFAHWIREYRIDGFRVDASWAVRERAPEFWPRWREELKRIEPDLFLLAEASARDAYYVQHGFDAAYDWTSRLGEWAWNDAFAEHPPDVDALRAALTNRGAGFPPDTLALRFLNNNDTGARFVTRHGPALARAAAVLLFTVPGVPLIYNGDEVGAEFEPYDEAPPLEWHDRHGLLPHYARLAKLRRSIGALASRRLELIATNDDSVIAFLRPGAVPGESVLVVVNFGARATEVTLRDSKLPGVFRGGRVEDLLTGTLLTIDARAPDLELRPYQGVVLTRAGTSP